jgi:hypothetical protein
VADAIQDLFDAINKKGWRVLNLFQTQDGGWQANVNRPAAIMGGAGFAHEFCRGDTAAEALSGAMKDMDQLRNKPVVPWEPGALSRKEIKAVKANIEVRQDLSEIISKYGPAKTARAVVEMFGGSEDL